MSNSGLAANIALVRTINAHTSKSCSLLKSLRVVRLAIPPFSMSIIVAITPVVFRTELEICPMVQREDLLSFVMRMLVGVPVARIRARL